MSPTVNPEGAVALLPVLLHALLAVLLMAGWVTVLAALDAPTARHLALAAANVGAALGLGAYLARRDPVVFGRWALWSGVLCFPITFLSVGWEPWVLRGVCALAVVGALVQLLRERRRGPDGLGATLFEAVHAPTVWEMEGIHLAFEAVAGAPAGGLARIAIGLQNCWSTPRTVKLELEAEDGPPLRQRLAATRRLAGGEAGVLLVHAQLPVDHRGRYTLVLEVGVSGWGGRRVVAQRGTPFENAVRGPEQALLLLMGSLKWGGGLRLKLLLLGGTTVENLAPSPTWTPLDVGPAQPTRPTKPAGPAGAKAAAA
jgi:hypothetical protein